MCENETGRKEMLYGTTLGNFPQKKIVVSNGLVSVFKNGRISLNMSVYLVFSLTTHWSDFIEWFRHLLKKKVNPSKCISKELQS